MVARGLTNAQIAEILGVTVHAVKFHLAAVYRKLGVTNRTEAARWAHERALVDEPRPADLQLEAV
jgi:DNA-binding CsgD family transcriptional regulator